AFCMKYYFLFVLSIYLNVHNAQTVVSLSEFGSLSFYKSYNGLNYLKIFSGIDLEKMMLPKEIDVRNELFYAEINNKSVGNDYINESIYLLIEKEGKDFYVYNSNVSFDFSKSIKNR